MLIGEFIAVNKWILHHTFVHVYLVHLFYGNFLFKNQELKEPIKTNIEGVFHFQVRNLKLMILTSDQSNQNGENTNPYESNQQGNKRRIYVLLFISMLQPLFMWWLTYKI